ncbi:hypothetical protein Tco_1359481 [Tanacetum coccineum]
MLRPNQPLHLFRDSISASGIPLLRSADGNKKGGDGIRLVCRGSNSSGRDGILGSGDDNGDNGDGGDGAFDVELEEPMKDQPLSANASPTTLSPDNYDNKSSDDDNNDDVEKDEEDEEEEEHLAPADPSTVPTDDPVPSS